MSSLVSGDFSVRSRVPGTVYRENFVSLTTLPFMSNVRHTATCLPRSNEPLRMRLPSRRKNFHGPCILPSRFAPRYRTLPLSYRSIAGTGFVATPALSWMCGALRRNCSVLVLGESRFPSPAVTRPARRTQDYCSATPLLYESKFRYEPRVPGQIRESQSSRFFRPLLYQLSYLGESLILVGNLRANRASGRAMARAAWLADTQR